jgi:Flp pilus assembly protein CpaB
MIIGVLIAVVAFAGVIFLGNKGQPPPTGGVGKVPTTSLVVASRDIPPLSTITGDMLTTAAYASTSLPPQYNTTPKEVVGKVALIDIPAGSPVLNNELSTSPNQAVSSGVQALTVPQGKVALTIPVKPGPQTVDGFLHPGDHINLLVTMTVPSLGTEVQQSMQDLVIYKMGGPAEQVAAAAAGQSSATGVINPATAVTMTLILTPQDAVTLEYLTSQNPSFIFVLRSPLDNTTLINTNAATQQNVASQFKF